MTHLRQYSQLWCVLQAQPFLSYVVLGLNLSVYAAGLAVRFSMGESSGEDYFYMLAKVNDEVTHGEYYRCAFCSLGVDATFFCFVFNEVCCSCLLACVYNSVVVLPCLCGIAHFQGVQALYTCCFSSAVMFAASLAVIV